MLSFTAILPAVRRSNTHEIVYTRVLAALRHFDWATGAEVIEAMNADEREAVTARTALAYFVRTGLLLVRGRRNEQQWRLNVSAFPRRCGGKPKRVKASSECTQCFRQAAPNRKQCTRCLDNARDYYRSKHPVVVRKSWGEKRRDANRIARVCVNENKAGTHGEATHGVRCERCDASHKRSR